jgi:hypothetical protein
MVRGIVQGLRRDRSHCGNELNHTYQGTLELARTICGQFEGDRKGIEEGIVTPRSLMRSPTTTKNVQLPRNCEANQ